MSLRILFVTRHYPPEISGGARRPSAIIAALRRAQVEVTLCAPHGVCDPDLISVTHPSFPAMPREPSPLSRRAEERPGIASQIANWCRRNLLLPDPEIRWALRVAKTVKASGRRFDWILTSSPPESLHVAGAILRASLKIPWVADVRDHWIETPQRQELKNNPLRAALEIAIAKCCFKRVDAMTVVSSFVYDEIERYVPRGIPNLVLGHFAEAYTGPPEDLPKENLNLVHTGAVGLSNPLSDFSAMLTDFETLLAGRSNAMLWLAGAHTEAEMALIDQSNARDSIQVLGPVPMQRARALQNGADILVLVSGRTSTALPGKFSEYAQTRKPIVLSAPGPWMELLPKDTTTLSWSALRTWAKRQTDVPASTTVHNSADRAAADLLNFLNKCRPPQN